MDWRDANWTPETELELLWRFINERKLADDLERFLDAIAAEERSPRSRPRRNRRADGRAVRRSLRR